MLNIDIPEEGMSVGEYYRKVTKQAKKQVKMENELRSFGTEVPGGYSMTQGQLARYFLSKEKKRR